MKPIALAIAILFATGVPAVSQAQVAPVPSLMNFQGRLARPDGTPVADGTYNLQFSLFNALTGGTLWWQRSLTNVPLKNGTVAARLDFSGGYQNGATQASLFATSAVYLEISINGGTSLAPRQPLVTVAYAMKADAVKDGAITGASIANGTITADKFAANIFNPLTWLLNGNSGVTTGFLGTTDTNPLELRVNNRPAMRYSYAENTANAGLEYRSINVLGGSDINFISAGVVGATIAGGGQDYFTGTDYPNSVTANFGTVGGGVGNTTSGPLATIAGGQDNTASGDSATVVGGGANTASAAYATVVGGDFNTASGSHSFAAGHNANALHTGTFVWTDSTNDYFASTAANQFLIRAKGGVGINTTTLGGYALNVNGNVFIASQLTLGSAFEQTSAGDFNIDAINVVGGRVKVLTNGNVGIGTTTPSFKLDVAGHIRCTSLTQTSDARYKTHIAPFDNALDTILQLRGVTFDWNRDAWKECNFPDGRQIGFIAQEVEKVLPELVSTDRNGYKSVAYANVVPVLVEAVKMQQKQIEALKKQNEQKDAAFAAVLARLERLEANRK